MKDVDPTTFCGDYTRKRLNATFKTDTDLKKKIMEKSI